MALLRVNTHFFTGVWSDGQVGSACLPYEFCEEIPDDFFDVSDLEFGLNVFYFGSDSNVALVGNLDAALDCSDENGFILPECWQQYYDSQSQFAGSELAPAYYVDPNEAYSAFLTAPELLGQCCGLFWRCTDAVGGDPCSDDTEPVFIQYMPSIGPAGFSDPYAREAADAKIETFLYCGSCGDDGLLDLTSVPSYPGSSGLPSFTLCSGRGAYVG